MDDQIKPLEVLLIGSGPQSSAAEFFKATYGVLSNHLSQVPDGESGIRANYVGWQQHVFPIAVVRPRWGGQYFTDSTTTSFTLDNIKTTGYDDEAIASYKIFCELKASGTIPSDVRFQVSLPTPLSVVQAFVEDDGVCARIEPLYEERLLHGLRHVQENIPTSELAI